MDNSRMMGIDHPFHCTTPVQLRFSDLDTLGHVNNHVYFSLFDVAKSDYFSRAKGEKLDWTRVNLVMANVNCNFIKQVLYDEPVVVKTQVDHIGYKSFTLVHVLANGDTGEVKCVCRQVLVYVDPVQMRPVSLPQEWRDAFCRFEGRDLSKE